MEQTKPTRELAFRLVASWLLLSVFARLLVLGKYPVPTVKLLGEGALELKGRFLVLAFANGLATDLVMFTLVAGPPLLVHSLSRRPWVRRTAAVVAWAGIGALVTTLFMNWQSYLHTDRGVSFMLLAMFVDGPVVLVGFLAREAGGYHWLILLLLALGSIPAGIGYLFEMGLRRLPESTRARLFPQIRTPIIVLLVLAQVVFVLRAAMFTDIRSLRGRWLYTSMREYEDPTWRLITGAVYVMTTKTMPKEPSAEDKEKVWAVLTPWDERRGEDPKFPLFRPLVHTGPRVPDPPLPPKPANVALLFLESTGTQDIGVYGDPDPITPCFDKLANEGLRFTRYATSASDSAGAFFAAMTSVYPELSSGREANVALQGSLAASLREKGYQTGFVVVRDTAWRKISEVTRGMDVMPIRQGRNFWGDDRLIYRQALEWVDKTKSPWMLAVFSATHHSPWVLPEGDQVDLGQWGNSRTVLKYQDQRLCEFVGELRAREKKSDRPTLLVIVGDHGLHIPRGKTIHIGGLREDSLPVPGVLHAPGWIEPGTSDVLGSHVDLMPTILDLLGIEGVKTGSMGRSLLRGGQGRVFTVNAGGAGYLGLLRDDRKLVLDVFSGEPKMYRHGTDELVFDDPPERTHAMMQELIAMHRLSSWLLISRRIAPRVPDTPSEKPPDSLSQPLDPS